MARGAEKQIWVYGDLRNERLFGFCLNVLSKARKLAGSVSAKVAVVLMGSSAHGKDQDLIGDEGRVLPEAAADRSIVHGADHVYILDHNELAVSRADLFAVALAGCVSEKRPMLVMIALSDFTREMAARAARLTKSGLIAECADLSVDEGRVVAKCPSWAGEIMADIAFAHGSVTGFVTVQPHAFPSVEAQGDPGTVEWIPLGRLEKPRGIRLLSSSREPEEKQKLENARIVVVGGAGLGNTAGFGLVRELSAALGGEVGATRPPVFQHWVDEERLIGQTGKAVRPDLLVSVGTSGAVQYTAGIMEAKTIVAINRDPNAPIFQISDFGIVADAKNLLPKLTAKVKRASMRRLADVLYEGDITAAKDGFGEKVRTLRESHDWSIETMAQATGQSPEFIEKIENDEIAPPVSFLLRFSDALKVDPGTFLRREEKAMIRNLRAQAFVKRTQDYSYQTLSPGAEMDHLRAFMITIEPGQTHKPVAYKHEGEEFVFVLEGGLKLTVGKKVHQLKPGESLHFNSDTPHKLKSVSNEMTRCLVVLYTP